MFRCSKICPTHRNSTYRVLYKWMHHNLLVSIVSLCRRDCTEAGAILFVDFTLKFTLQKNIHTIINSSRQRVHTFRIISLNYIKCAFFSSARKQRIASLPPMNIYKMCAYLLLRCIYASYLLYIAFFMAIKSNSINTCKRYVCSSTQ